MATLQTQTSKGVPLTVIYPAERPVGRSAIVRLRVGKKTVLPAYTDDNLRHLVQFQKGQTVVMFMLSDVLQCSYWERIRNAYTVLGQLDVDEDAKLSLEETGRVVQWLKAQSPDVSCATN
jgi:hypothetical protein